jgi:hypothetical protein
MVGCEYRETVLVTTGQGDEEMQVILGGSGLTKSGIHVFFTLLPGERERMRKSAWDLESRIAEVDCLASWFCVRWVVGGSCEASLECEAPKVSSNQTLPTFSKHPFGNEIDDICAFRMNPVALDGPAYNIPLRCHQDVEVVSCSNSSMYATREQPYHPNPRQSI